MENLHTFIRILESSLFIWAAIAASYMFIYAIFGTLYTEKKEKPTLNDSLAPRIAVIIPAYKEDAVIMKTVESALRQIYPIGKFLVTVVADQLQRTTLYKLQHLPVNIIEVDFENSTKSKALNKAMDTLPEHFDLVVILDADNIIRPDFLHQMGAAYLAGYKAIQGHRTAKNFGTAYSLLDAISEEINNTIFCKGQQYLGMSSRLTGSGMGFEYKLFKQLMSGIHAVGGFDKELELRLISSGATIHYLPTAFIYDEKVNKPEIMAKQRSRWISSQFHYMKKYVPGTLYYLIKNKNFDYFNKSIQLIIPPRMFMLLLIFVGIIIGMLSSDAFFVTSWIILGLTYILAFIIAFPKKFAGRQLLKLFISVPHTFFKLFTSIPSMFTANKKFLHTPHEL